MEIICNSIEETQEFAKSLADKMSGGEVILLNGDLGAGKTTFTQGFAKGLGVEKRVTSPTFTIMKEYDGRLKLYHFDMYRISHEDEVEELGFEDYLFSEEGVSIIEWSKYNFASKDVIIIDIEKLGDFERKFLVRGICI